MREGLFHLCRLLGVVHPSRLDLTWDEFMDWWAFFSNEAGEWTHEETREALDWFQGYKDDTRNNDQQTEH